MARQLVIVSDQGFFQIWIRKDLNEKEFDNIEDQFGFILTTNSVTEELLSLIAGSRGLEPLQKEIWSNRVKSCNKSLENVLSVSGLETNEIFRSISDDAVRLLRVIKGINPRVDIQDAEVLATAAWIRAKTDYEPLILSDDKDLLCSSHMISSFFGLCLTILSGYELLRLCKIDSALGDYCDHFTMDPPAYTDLIHVSSNTRMQDQIWKLMGRTKVSLHPAIKMRDRKAMIFR